MKRKPPSDLPYSELKNQAKRAKKPEYHETPSVCADDGEIVWPAEETMMEGARGLLREW